MPSARSSTGKPSGCLQDDGGAIVAMWASFIHAHSKGLAHDDKVAANWISDGNKVAERWWFS
jgi:peptide/nickel transport system substrate-binding protein